MKLSFFVGKTLFYEALTCTRMLEVIDPMFLKKIHLHDFWLWRLFYQPNWEISSLVKRNNHLKGKKVHRKLGCDICLVF